MSRIFHLHNAAIIVWVGAYGDLFARPFPGTKAPEEVIEEAKALYLQLEGPPVASLPRPVLESPHG